MLIPSNLLKSRVEVHIVNNILPSIKKSTDVLMIESALKSIDLVGKSVHPEKIKLEFQLKTREEIVKTILSLIHQKINMQGFLYFNNIKR